MGKAKPFWSMKNLAKNKGELTLYGRIAESSWWDDVVTPKKFIDDLKNLGDITELDVRINSGGGDVFAAQAIHSQLKAHKAHVNVYIDGLAASAASVIAMAGDTVYIPSNAMIMIHNPWTMAVGEAKDMEKMADTLGKVKETIIAAYEAKTNLSKEELSELMDEETWLTGTEAVEKGFADELLNALEVSAALKGEQLFINGMGHDLNSFSNIPNFISRASETPTPINQKTLTKEEEIVDLNKIKNDYPQLYQQIKNEGKEEGVQSERNRMQAIDDISMPGYEEIINKAKYESGISAEAAALEIIKFDKQRAQNYLGNVQLDANPLNQVPGAPAPQGLETEEEQIKNAAKGLAAFANQKRGLNK